MSEGRYVERWRSRAWQLKVETYTIYLAYRDPRVAWYAKAFAACVVAYAVSPIDLIPDFVPVLGYLDDLVLIPLGIALALKMIPAVVLAESWERARERMAEGEPVSWVAGGVILALWLLALLLVIVVVLRAIQGLAHIP